MAVEVLKVAGIAAPECLVRRLDDPRSGPRGLPHDRVDFRRAVYVVTQAHLGGAARTLGDTCVPRQILPGPQGELEAGLEIDEDDRAVLELGAHDASGGKPEPVAVEPERALQVVHAQCYQGDVGIHWFKP